MHRCFRPNFIPPLFRLQSDRDFHGVLFRHCIIYSSFINISGYVVSAYMNILPSRYHRWIFLVRNQRRFTDPFRNANPRLRLIQWRFSFQLLMNRRIAVDYEGVSCKQTSCSISYWINPMIAASVLHARILYINSSVE